MKPLTNQDWINAKKPLAYWKDEWIFSVVGNYDVSSGSGAVNKTDCEESG
jgi:hypothetical protein|tara:strand:+ start:9417 stop:9566 length:150 start_codon:yes stop_codon:yes gene_type:complete